MSRVKKPRTEAGRAKAVLFDLADAHLNVKPGESVGLTSILERAKGTQWEGEVRALLATIDGPKAKEFEACIEEVLRQGKYPNAINIHIVQEQRSYPDGVPQEVLVIDVSRTLNGNEARWRREFLEARGWKEKGGRWRQPT